MSIGILPNVNSINTNRDVRQGISDCSRIFTLTNNQTKSRKRATIPKKEEKSDDKNAVAIVGIVSQVGGVSQDSELLDSQRDKQAWETRCKQVFGPIRRIRFTQSTLRQASIQENKGPSLGKIQVKHPHQQSPYAMKFEDWSQEETEIQQRCARGKAGNLVKNIYKLKEKDKATFFSPTNEWCLPAPSIIEPQETELVVDSRASMHMVSKKDLNSAELETMRTSRSPTTVITANGEVQTREEATVFVKELDFFVTVMLLEETPAVLPLGKLCEDHGYTYHWTSSQKPHLTKNGKRIDCNISNDVPFEVPGLSTSSSTSSSPTSTSSSQDSVMGKANPATERSGSMSAELRGNLMHKPTETENKNKNEGREELRGGILHDLTDWLQGFRENLVDESVPLEPRGNLSHEHRDTSSSSHELPMESPSKVDPGSGKPSIYTHFPKDPNCDICLKTKITRGFLQKTCWYRRAQRGKKSSFFLLRITMFSVKKVNHATIVDMPSTLFFVGR